MPEPKPNIFENVPPVLRYGLILALIALVLILWWVNTPKASGPAESTTTQAQRTEVVWDDYDPSVKHRIDDLQAAKNCAELQAEFDTAEANSATTMDRTGHSNAALMGYIDEALGLAGCYG